MNRWLFLWARLRSQVWVRATLYAVFGCLAALAAALGAPFVPREMAERLGGESVEALLNILASSLLAVATFSLGAMVSAYTAMSQSATPRVAALITSDGSTQKSLSTFVGAFLYAVVATTAVNANYYGAEGRAVLFVTSLIVVVLVAVRLLSWISRLSSLARLSHMIELVEDRTTRALESLPAVAPRPHEVVAGPTVSSPRTGYVQNVDRRALQAAAEARDLRIEILAPTGAFVRQGEPLCRVAGDAADAVDEIRSAFVLDRGRTYEQDPRHGLTVLGEIGARALSRAVNDPGTAIEIVGVAVRVLDGWARTDPSPVKRDRAACDRLSEAPIHPADLLDDVYGPIVRHGSQELSVAIRMQKALRSLAAADSVLTGPAMDLSRQAARRALRELEAEDADRFRREFDLAPDVTEP